jgi:hypothetical protein
VFSKIGFITDTDTVILSPGVVKLDSFKLCTLPLFSYSGNIYDNSSLTGIPNANVSIYDQNTRWDTVTDASGNFTIPNMFSGTYNISAGKWGHVTDCIASQNITSTASVFSMGLNTGIYDDFTWDWNWVVTGNATGGVWERGKPKGTLSQGAWINPNADVIIDCGDEAYVTGNQGITASDDDVDGGTTILTSPVFDLSGYTEPYVFFSRWKRISFNSTDTILITMSNGTTTATFESISALTSGQSAWLNHNYKISSKLAPTATMTFRMQVSDYGPDNTNEGGLDRFFILDSTNSSVHELANKVDVVVYPNPFTTSTSIVVNSASLKGNGLSLKLCDVFGQELRTVYPEHGTLDFKLDRNKLGSGIYFYRIFDRSELISTGKICVE